MKCPVCGGELFFLDDIYVCGSCGSRQQISGVFENTEVFICYVENDAGGRRAKDSIIAANLYNALKNAKVNTFYSHVSAADLTEDYYEKAYFEAIWKAKIIIITAVSRENFECLLKKNKKYFTGKRIIPVYSGIEAYDIPEELAVLQAVNYDSIGAVVDLTKTILKFLNRGNEIKVERLFDEKTLKRRKKLMVMLAACLAIICGFAVYVFGTPYVLNSKKYEHAKVLYEKGLFVRAIDIYTNLDDYKNSQSELERVYNKYDGYFLSEDGTMCLYLNINKGSYVKMEVMRDVDGKTVRFKANFQIYKNGAEFNFADSQKNFGTGRVELLDRGIKLDVETECIDELSFGVVSEEFQLKNRTDKPIVNQVTKEELLGWLKKYTTIYDVQQKGYELEFVAALFFGDRYRIVGTDIMLVFRNEWSTNMMHSVNKHLYASLVEGALLSISAPVKMLMPERIGEESSPFIKDGFCYSCIEKEGERKGTGNFKPQQKKAGIIEEDDEIAVDSEVSLGDAWREECKIVQEEFARDKVAEYVMKEFATIKDAYYPYLQWSNDTHYIFTVEDEQSNTYVFTIENETYAVKYRGTYSRMKKPRSVMYFDKRTGEKYPEPFAFLPELVEEFVKGVAER